MEISLNAMRHAPEVTATEAQSAARLLASAPHRVVAEFAGSRRLISDLDACVSGVDRAVARELPIVPETVGALLTGGKRLRPLLVLATGYAAGPGPSGPGPSGTGHSGTGHSGIGRERSIESGVVVELLHLASLVHDDVMDEATRRHGASSANARMGNVRAVLAGDYLLAKALAAGCRLGRSEGALAAETFVRLCEGQAHESAVLFDVERTERAYYAAIEGKTGALFAASCRLGAMAAGFGPATTTALADYGLHLGVAFQLVDDLLDLTSSSDAMGKPAGHDIAEGVYTLPVLHALREHPRLAALLRSGDVEEAVQVTRDSGGLTATRRAAERRTGQAIGALAGAAGEVDATGISMLTELVAALVGRSH